MKKYRFFAIALAVLLLVQLAPVPAFAAAGDVAINEENFPDANFRSYVSSNFDRNYNGVLSEAERNAVTEIS